MAWYDRILGRKAGGAVQRPRYFRPGEEDVFLVSFPRSGSTWLRAAAAEMMFGTSGQSLADLDRFVPDVHVKIPQDEVAPGGFHLVKSHWPRCRREGAMRYRRVVYLVRDPRDVVLSHDRYLRQIGQFDGDFDAFLTEWLHGRIFPCSWSEHVLSWMGDAGQADDCDKIVVRYENLVERPVETLARVAGFLRLDCNEGRLRQIVERTSPQRMRRKEQKGMRAHLQVAGLEFIGPARADQWQGRLTEDQVRRIVESAGRAMVCAGYL
jgi:hypothetical protein